MFSFYGQCTPTAGDNPALSYQPAKQHRQLTHKKPIPFADCKKRLARKRVPAQEKTIFNKD